MRKIGIAFMLFLLFYSELWAQQEKKPFKVEGTIGVSHDYYSLSGVGIEQMRGRRPDNLTRFQLYTRFSRGKISLPFEVSFSTQSSQVNSTLDGSREIISGFAQMKTANDVLRFVSNPVNRIGFSPTLGKYRFRLGTSTPYFSELVLGSLSQFGAGIDYTGKRAFWSAGYGLLQAGQSRDTSLGRLGTYQREQAYLRLGLGRIDASFFALNAVAANDYAVSGLLPDSTVKPQQGLALSAQWRIQLGRVFFWESEAAGSLFTENKNGIGFKTEEVGLPELPNEIKLTTGSYADIAGNSSFGLEVKGFRLSAKALYVGAGYRSVAYPFMQADRMELTLNPRFQLFKGNVLAEASLGKRVNNLSKTKAEPMEQLIIQSNLSIRFTNWFSLSGGYSNFGTRNGILNDSFSIENVSRNFQVAPLFTFQGKKAIHSLLFSFNKDDFEDLNVITGRVGNNQSEMMLASWNRNPLQGPFSFGLSYNRFKFSSSFANLFNQSYSLNLGAKMFKRRLQTNFSLGRLYNLAALNETEDQQWVLNAGVDYRAKKGFGFGVRWNNNNYLYGSARPNSRFNEHTVRVSCSWQF